MKRKYFFISVFLVTCVISACGKTEINYDEISVMSEDEREQEYIEYLTEEIKNALMGFDGINSMDIEIIGDTGAWNVNVKIDYSDLPLDVTDMNQSIEKVLTNFLPEGTDLSVVGE